MERPHDSPLIRQRPTYDYYHSPSQLQREPHPIHPQTFLPSPNLRSPVQPPLSTLHGRQAGVPGYHQPISPIYQRPFSSPEHHRSTMASPYEIHAHPGSRQGSLHQSPILANGSTREPPAAETRPLSQGKPDRTSNPMSFASILSSNNHEPSPPKQSPAQIPRPLPPPQSPIKLEHPMETNSAMPTMASPTYRTNGFLPNIGPEPARLRMEPTIPDKPRYVMTKAEKERFAAAISSIDEAEFSEEDAPGFYEYKLKYIERTKKRARDVDIHEGSKKRKRRVYLVDELIIPVAAHVAESKARFAEQYGAECAKEINDRDVADEKERKKDMQRKRRREQQIKNEEQRLADLQRQQQDTEDPEEALKFSKQIQRSKDKLLRTAELLEGGGQDELEVPPMALNLEGGTTSSFHLDSEEPTEPPRKKVKGMNGAGNRPKKSKEKKQAEKDAAEAAWAAGWLESQQFESSEIPITPREEPRPLVSKPSRKPRSDIIAVVNYDSKGYQQLVEQITRDMARKDVPKVFKIKQQSMTVKIDNARKTAILASKQARKWQERTNKSMKDTQARAKRVMREMMSFWKRNEREERDQRRLAERKEIEDAKKAEADREANRQRRKLNFLISQTELYSHFIGKRIKTDEIERATDDPDVASSAEKIQDTDKKHEINLPPSVADMTGKTKVTNFEDLDFDAEDETALQEAAMANAHNAMEEARARAKAFDGEDDDDQMAAMDNSDMNFMNPTMAGDVEVTQPKMLTAQLKEYQLKGLNWLVNLYEQGINGILADEMGLGKTIQSISVMGYLAEQHNVWGPFLVIAPASTLHNWQQEITRFVPDLKVLPYWGNAKDRKILRKFWDRKHISYNKESEFHVLVTSYQLVVQDAQYFQKVKWQYMILDEAQAIKSSQSSRWKVLLSFNCRNRLLLTGTPIQNNMQELWALLHFIMPTLFDSHDEFSEWFSKDIESHAQSNTKLNQDQLRRLHMILKPFMLRRVKAHVQKELGDKLEKDIFCDLSYRQRAYYANLRSKISIMDLIEKASMGDDQDAATLMNLVMQFRKVCNHPDLFERADTVSPFSMSSFAETASFMREGSFVQVGYSIKNQIEYDLPRILSSDERLDIAGPHNQRAGFLKYATQNMFNIFDSDNVAKSSREDDAFSFLRFVDMSAGEVSKVAKTGLFDRAIKLKSEPRRALDLFVDEGYESEEKHIPAHSLFNIVNTSSGGSLKSLDTSSNLAQLCNISTRALVDEGFTTFESAARSLVCAPPIEVSALGQFSNIERQNVMFNPKLRNALFTMEESVEQKLLENDVDPRNYPPSNMYPAPASEKARFTSISVPSMRRFVTDSGKLAKLDELLRQLKVEGHRVLLYFQMTRMIDLMEEYLTYRNYKYCRLDGSTKLEDRRDTVHDFQTRPEIFIFLLSTRAGGLGINLTSADTVIFYDSDWNPTIDSQAMDRAHRLGQTKQVTVYRLITRGTIEERIRKRAMQKEEVQRVVITGGDGSGVDFNTRSRGENRTKDIAMWLADDDQAAIIEAKEKERDAKQEEKGEKKMSKKALAAAGAAERRRAKLDMESLYHEGEGNFDDQSAKASGDATPVPSAAESPAPKKKGGRTGVGKSKKAKTAAQRLAIVDAAGDLGMGGGN